MTFSHGKGRPLSAFEPTWEARWVIEDIWQTRGVNMLCGAPRARKSTLNAYLIVCALTGKPAFGILKIEPIQRAAIFLGEGIPEAEATRFYTALTGLGLDPTVWSDRLTIFGPDALLRFDPDANADVVRRTLQAEAYDFVSFDPLVNFHGQEENKSSMAPVMAQITSFTEFATVSLCHHVTKPMNDAPIRSLSHQARGHSSIAGYTAVNMVLERSGSSNEHTLRTDAKYTEKHGSMELRFKSGVWIINEDSPEARVLEALQVAPCSRTELVDGLHMNRNRAFGVIDKLISRGQIQVSGTDTDTPILRISDTGSSNGNATS